MKRKKKKKEKKKEKDLSTVLGLEKSIHFLIPGIVEKI
jgi:hypothetical protein